MKILMVAAENGALPGGKVGGMGDVIRDIPSALGELGHTVDVIMPGYQHFSLLPDAESLGQVGVGFRGKHEVLELFDLPRGSAHHNVRCRVIDHPGLAPAGAGEVYCNDPPERPFASDASKFSLFCVGVAQALIDGLLDDYDVIHLHDWHSAMLAVLIRNHPKYQALGNKRLVYTIHNLSLQGIRPLQGDTSSLKAWFPELAVKVQDVQDLRYPDCFNPMRAAIRLCDRVHAVSPTYAREIQLPSAPDAGFIGGEGLETDLSAAAEEGRLYGILNGCEYAKPRGQTVRKAATAKARTAAVKEMYQALHKTVATWLAAKDVVSTVHFLALDRLSTLLASGDCSPDILVTSVGRLTEQKVFLLRQTMNDGRSALEHVLEQLQGGVLLVLGSGDKNYEQFFIEIAAQYDNVVFINGYSEPLSQLLYERGDLFLMPSSFEPCGISQMLAMRAGQPCLVNAVGGLLDTVIDSQNGFLFAGDSPKAQAEHMVSTLAAIVELRTTDKARWKAIGKAAGEARFLWSSVAEQYVSDLYQG